MLGHYTTPPVKTSIAIAATRCQRALVSQSHFSPFTSTRITAAGPQNSVGDVDDDAANGAVVEVALRGVMLADRARIVGVVGHQLLQPAGVQLAPREIDKRFEPRLAEP